MGVSSWSTATNWTAATPPLPSSQVATLDFPALAGAGCAGISPSDACYTSANDVSGLSVDQLAIADNDGYDLSGQGIALGSGGISASPATGPSGSLASIELPITLDAPQTWTIAGPNGGAIGQSGVALQSPLTGANDALTIDTSNSSGLLLTSETEVGAISVNGVDTSDTGIAAQANGGVFLTSSGSLNSSDGSSINLHDAGLEAAGTLGSFTSAGGDLVVGEPTGVVRVASATFDAASNVTFSIASEAAVGTGNSQLVSGGPIALGGASLTIEAPVSGKEACGPTLPIGQRYTFILTTGTISGAFGNAPEGSEIALTQPSACPPQHLRIGYKETGSTQTVTATVVGVIPNSGSITGKVTDASTKAVVAGIEVCGFGSAGDECADTNASGEYTISNLAAGAYSVEFLRPFESGLNYLPQFYSDTTSYANASKVSVTAGVDTSGIDAALEAGAQIAGRVVAATTNAALAGIQVCAYVTSGEYSGGCATTNAGGEYTVPGLVSGQYTVDFSVPYASGLDYLPQYYEDKSSASEAQPISVTTGITTPGIDASMQVGGQITGRVISASTKATVAGIEVCAFESNGAYVGRCATTNASGEYTVSALASGQYTLWFSAPYESNLNYLSQYYNGKSLLAEAIALSVTAGETTPADGVELQQGGLIIGKVTGASTKAPLVGIEACAHVTNDVNVQKCVTTNSRGEYTVSGLASGQYTVGFSIAYGSGLNYLPQYYSGKSSLAEGSTIFVTAGEAASGIDAELQEGGLIVGKVTSASTKAPLADIEVCPVSKGGFDTGQCRFTNATGEYTLSGLVGEYEVEFLPANLSYLAQYFNGKSLLAEGEEVSVSPGGTASGIDAELTEGGLIAGTVTGASTKAGIEGIEVCLYRTNGEYAGYCTFTDASGEYRLQGLVGGEYKVAFYGNSTHDYVTQYFSDKFLFSEAKAVSIAAGGTVAGIDAELVEGGQIAGSVTSASTKAGIEGIEVCAYPRSAGREGECVFTGLGGGYTLPGVAGGEYTVEFLAPAGSSLNYLPQQYKDGTTGSAIAVLVTVGQTTSGIDGALQAGLSAIPTNTSPPVLSGTAAVGQTLTEQSGSWSGLPTSFGRQWLRCTSAGTDCVGIAGAVGQSYQVSSADVGFTIRVQETASNFEGSSVPVSSNTSAVVPVPPVPVNTAAPRVVSTDNGNEAFAETGSWMSDPTGFTYQWERCDSSGASCTAIANATGAYYLLAETDVGGTLRVQVGASNAGGASTPATSAPSAVVQAPPASIAPPTISGLARQGQTLTEAHGSWNGSPSTYSYRWERCDSAGNACAAIAGATSQTYVLSNLDVGATIRVQETAASSVRDSLPALSTVTAVVQSAPGVPASTAPPTISGSAQQGQTLTESPGAWTGSPTAYSYQWLRCGAAGTGCVAISGAVGQSYVPSSADGGLTIRVQETAIDSSGMSVPVSSNATSVVPAAPGATSPPTISGSTQVGQTLTESHGVWTGSPVSYSYRWLRCDAAGISCTAISGAIGQSYQLAADDLGSTIEAQETATNTFGPSVPSTSRATFLVTQPPPVNTAPPTVSGVAQQGQALTAAEGSWTNSPTDHSYQWLRCSSVGAGCSPIVGATGQAYVPLVSDVGHELEVQETASNEGGSSNPAGSLATPVVLPEVPHNTSVPRITGVPEQAHTLTEAHGSWTNSPTEYTYQWLQCNSLGAACIPIAGAEAQTYVPGASDVGGTLEVQEVATNIGGSGSPATSASTGKVLTSAPVALSPPTISGSAQQGQTLTEVHGSWTGEPTVFEYQWLRCDEAGEHCSSISAATGQTYVLTAADAAHAIEVQEVASNAGGPSSPQASAATLVVSPLAPTNLAAPQVAGVAEQGQVLSESHGSWANDPIDFEYQWERCDGAGAGCEAIVGATSQTFELTAVDVGHTLKVQEIASNVGGPSSPALSAATATVLTTIVVPPAPVNIAAPKLSGSAQQGQMLTEVHGSWTNSPTEYTYQWLQCNSLGAGCLPIVGATGQSYGPTAGDVGHTLEVVETAGNAGGQGSPAISSPSAIVAAAPPANIAPPRISGTARQGQALTEEHGSWTGEPTSFSYQWLRCDESAEHCAPIATATGQIYVSTGEDVGHTLEVTEIATNTTGPSSPTTSAPTGVLEPAAPINTAPPTVSGVAQQGQTLAETHGSWTNSPSEYSYQWLRCEGALCQPISGATGQTYIPVAGDLGYLIEVQEAASNAGGSGVPATSTATVAVIIPPLHVSVGENISTTPGEPVSLNGSGSTPAQYIDSYHWDFGDGFSAAGATATHIYDKPGRYTATLTVSDGAASASATVSVTVVSPPPQPVHITTLDENGRPIAAAEILYIAPDATRTEAHTGASGVANLAGLPDGSDTVYAYERGYQPAVGQVTVSGGSGQLTIHLSSGAIATSTLKSHEMTLAEIESAGIDTNDPANQMVFEFEVTLVFSASGEAPVKFDCHINSHGEFVGGCGFGGGSIEVDQHHCTPTGCQGDGLSVVPALVDGHPLIQWLVLRGKAAILKQFFAVSMIVQNLSPEPFKLTGGSATLTLPAGMSLAPTSSPQALDESVADIPGLGSATTTWVVRGDEPGDYYLSAQYNGELQPFAAPVTLQAALATPLHIWGANALSLDVQADSGSLAAGVPYHVRIGLTNKADIPLYNVSVSIDADTHERFIFQPAQQFTDMIGELHPGQTTYANQYILVPDAASAGAFNPALSSAHFVGETARPGAGIEALPPPPLYALSGPTDTPNLVHLHWQPVPGAEGYEVFSTPDLDTPFTASPEAVISSPSTDDEVTTLPGAATDAYLFGSSIEKPKYYAVSALIKGTPTLEFPVIPATAGAEPSQAAGGDSSSANGGVLGSGESSGGDNGAGAPAATCLKHSITLSGGITVEASCFHGSAGGLLTASGRIRVNGLDIETAGQVTLDTRTLELRSAGQVDVKAGSILIYKGDLAWNFRAQLSLGVPRGLTVKGLPIGGDITVSLVPGGARALANATIGGSFAVSGQIDLELTLTAGLKLNGLSLELASDIPIKSLVVKKAKLSYSRTSAGDVWEGDVAVDLPGHGPTVEGTLTLTNGSVSAASVDVSGINKPLGEVVFLQSLGLKVRFVPHLAATGSIGLSAGPAIDGHTAVSLDGSLTAEIGSPFVLEAAGTLSMVDEQLASASVKATIPGGVAFSGEISQSFLVLSVNGGISGSVTPHSFEAQGHVTVNEHVLSASGNALVNNAGLAGCASATVGAGILSKTVVIGGSHRWGGAYSLFTDACGFSRLQSALGARSAAVSGPPVIVRVAPHTRQLNLIVKGDSGPPEVVLSEGQSSALVRPNTTGAFAGTVYLAVADPTDDETDIAIADPPAGALTVAAPSGQPSLASVGSTVSLPAPNVRVKVHSIGRRRFRLSWSARAIAGQTLVFQDVDARGQAQVLSTTRVRGHIDFTALDDGSSGPHRLRVVVEQDGLTREILAGAIFRPAPLRLGKPRVDVRLRGKVALIGWSTVPSAAGYEVSLSTSDGRHLFFSVSPHQRSLRIPGAVRVSARVRGFGGGMEAGPLGSGSATAAGRSAPSRSRS
jgi:hypothetical protein